MKLQAVKKADESIWLVHGDASRVMEPGDQLIELPDNWQAPDAKYRSCWREQDGEIVIDLALARAQKLAEIRAERDRRLVESDKEWMVHMTTGQEMNTINAKKEALRDIPEAAEADLALKRSINTIEAYEPEWP